MKIKKYVYQQPECLFNLYKECFDDFEDRSLTDIEKIINSGSGTTIIAKKK